MDAPTFEPTSEAPWVRNSLRSMVKELRTLSDLAAHRSQKLPAVRAGAAYVAAAYLDAAQLIADRLAALED